MEEGKGNEASKNSSSVEAMARPSCRRWRELSAELRSDKVPAEWRRLPGTLSALSCPLTLARAATLSLPALSPPAASCSATSHLHSSQPTAPHRAPASRSSRNLMAPYPVHLCVVLHGLWGNPSHIGYVCRSLAAKAGANSLQSRQRASSPTRSTTDAIPTLVVLAAKLNTETKTYDGIDLCAERVVQEIDEGAPALSPLDLPANQAISY